MQADWHILPRIQKYIDSGMRYAYSILQQQQYRHADSVYTNGYFGTPTTSRSEIVAASDMAGAILTLCCLHTSCSFNIYRTTSDVCQVSI